MKKFVVSLVVALAVALSLFIGSTAANASADPLGNALPHHRGHWAKVYVENHASSLFQVKRAVRNWHSGMHYGHCRKGAACVEVYSHNNGDNGLLGWTYFAPGTYYHPVRIVLNTYKPYRWIGNIIAYQTAKHELGHSLGLPHDTDGGIMTPDMDGKHMKISKFERRELKRLYGKH